ncbi:MAG: aquaporin [Gemmataceae bacterium]
MEQFIDHPLVIPVGLGILGVNVVGWLALLFSRPASASDAADTAALMRALLAEGLGSFALLLMGTLTVLSGPITGGEPASPLTLALTYSLVLTACLGALGPLSGGHFNPVVTLAWLGTGQISPVAGTAYLVVQLVGATAATGLVGWLFGSDLLQQAIPAPGPNIPLRAAFLLEAIAMGLLLALTYALAQQSRSTRSPGPLMGVAHAGIMLTLIPWTGAALNPLRFLAPALTAQKLDGWLIYTTGPLVGGLVGAALVYLFLRPAEPTEVILHLDDEEDTQITLHRPAA